MQCATSASSPNSIGIVHAVHARAGCLDLAGLLNLDPHYYSRAAQYIWVPASSHILMRVWYLSLLTLFRSGREHSWRQPTVPLLDRSAHFCLVLFSTGALLVSVFWILPCKNKAYFLKAWNEYRVISNVADCLCQCCTRRLVGGTELNSVHLLLRHHPHGVSQWNCLQDCKTLAKPGHWH